jgi:hypothetical protein
MFLEVIVCRKQQNGLKLVDSGIKLGRAFCLESMTGQTQRLYRDNGSTHQLSWCEIIDIRGLALDSPISARWPREVGINIYRRNRIAKANRS